MSPSHLQWWTLPVLDLFMREKLRSDTFWTDHICDHISYRTAVLYEMVRWWGEVRLMGRANLKNAWVWFQNIEFVWRLCQTFHCLMRYHFTFNLSSGKDIRYSHNLYSLGLYLWVYYKWCIIMFLIRLLKWQRLCNVKWDTKTAINRWQESNGR